MQKTCQCGTKFEALKSFHFLCNECFKKAARCNVCKKIVLPKNGSYECCGISESEKYVEEATIRNNISKRMMARAMFGPFDAPEYWSGEDDEI